MNSEIPLDLFLFADNKPISESQYESVMVGIKLIEGLHWRTRDYIEENGLDTEVFLPRNVWSQICNLDTFHKWPYSLVNVCKIASPFTGHYMAMWGRVDMGHLESEDVARFYEIIFSEGVPANVDEILFKEFGLGERIEKYRVSLLESYDRLVDSVPDRFRVQTPDRMGEIGIRHDGNIVNFDTVTYQSRINALFGMGIIETLEKAILEEKRVCILEIGPGHCYMAYALQSILGCKAQVILVDLPRSLVHGYMYLAGIFGADEIQIVDEETNKIGDKPFVLVPNYLLPKLENQELNLDLTINAISLNEMNRAQNEYYLDFISENSKDGAFFHMEGGGKYLDEHVDSLELARKRFPEHHFFLGSSIKGVDIQNHPNTFYRIR